MSEKMQETIADIIAEMRGARTEFPFVYLMGEPDTPEVIDPKTKKIIEPRKINIRSVTVKELADRLEAAHRRDKVGNAAKMYEALCEIAKRIENICGSDECDDREISKIGALIKQTLAAPPRNCDRFGTDNCEATVAYEDYCEKCEIDETVEGAISWLLAPATE